MYASVPTLLHCILTSRAGIGGSTSVAGERTNTKSMFPISSPLLSARAVLSHRLTTSDKCGLTSSQADTSSLPAPSSSALPQPLQVPPSRARRQFAARLAQRKRALERDQAGSSPSNPSNPDDEGITDLDAPTPHDSDHDLSTLDTPQRAEFEQQLQEDAAAKEAFSPETEAGLSGWGVSAEPAAYDEGIAVRRGPERFSELFGTADSDSDDEDGVEMKAKGGVGAGPGAGGGGDRKE